MGWLVIVAGFVVMLIGWLGKIGKLPRNHFAGIRLPSTMRSDRAWASWRMFAVALIATMATSGCASVDSGVQSDGDHGMSETGPAGKRLYSCGRGGAFEGASLEGPADLEDDDSALGRALRGLIRTGDGVRVGEGWRIVWEKGRTVHVAAPSLDGEHPFVSALFESSGSEWDPVGWGECTPTAVVGNRSPAIWKLREVPSADSSELQVTLEERACSGGRELTNANTRSDVDYSETAITIIVTADPLGDGMYTCPLQPSSFTIQLNEPVGDRQLLDGSVYPPARRDA